VLCVYTIITQEYFCNSNPHCQTTVGESINFEFEEVEEGEFEQESDDEDVEYNELTILVWSDGKSLPSVVGIVDGNNPDGAPAPGNVDPLANHTSKGSSLWFTDAQHAKTKLLKMLNSILKWAGEAHTLGYNFM
jgi:hypothetical protein